MIVTVTNFTRTIKAGHGNDIFYSMELQRWQPQELSAGTYRNSTSDAPSNNGTKPKAKRYVLPEPMTLPTVALKTLSDPHQWRNIYKLNPKLADFFAPVGPNATNTDRMLTTFVFPKGTSLVIPVV
jgi:hypothetical protein